MCGMCDYEFAFPSHCERHMTILVAAIYVLGAASVGAETILYQS